MTQDELIEIIRDIRQQQCELPDVEVKSAKAGTPERLFEVFSAFANYPGGGVVLFGLEQGQDFEIVGVGNAQQLQERISDLSASEMEPALRPQFTIGEVAGKTVVAVEVSEVRAEQKPCYYKPRGLQGGSYIRAGNTNRRMTDYEIFGYVSARSQPKFDEEPIHDATLEDFDRPRLEDYLARLKRARPQAPYLNQPFEEVLNQLRIVKVVDSILRPTLAGLLVFGKSPQLFEPQLMITFLHFYGTIETETGPRGERFLDNPPSFEGPIPEMIESAVNHVLASMRKSSLITGLFRRDIPEYPEIVLREAVVNAVAHRDYSPYARGSHIQIRLFADRLEIQSPGGLYGNVHVETLEEQQSTRNRILMRMLEDLGLVENRGAGIRTMIQAMREANLQPPRFFEDKRSFFRVTFYNHTLMTPSAVAWLNRFASLDLNDHQRVALAYLHHVNQRVMNRDYQRLNSVDSVTANRDLRRLYEQGLIEQHGTRGGAFYTLVQAVTARQPDLLERQEERILAHVQREGIITNSQCREILGVDLNRACYLLRKLAKRGLLRREGARRWTRYRLP